MRPRVKRGDKAVSIHPPNVRGIDASAVRVMGTPNVRGIGTSAIRGMDAPNVRGTYPHNKC